LPGIPEGEIWGAVETARGSDVLAGKERRDGRLVEGVGSVDAVPAQMASGIRASRNRQSRRQVHEFAINCAGVAASDTRVEAVVAAHPAARLQRRRHVCNQCNPLATLAVHGTQSKHLENV